MKRGKPLKRTPLNRGSSQLKRSKLKYRSNKMNETYVERRALVSEVLRRNPYCSACKIFYVYDCIKSDSAVGVCHKNRSCDLHELVNRSQGGSILDDANIIAVCRQCHTRITTNPKEAERLGLHLESWCYTDAGIAEAHRVRDCWANGLPTSPHWMR